MQSIGAYDPSKRTISVGGIPVEIERKDVKRLSIKIKSDGTVHVSAPRRMSEAEVDAFVLSRQDWIGKHVTTRPTTSDGVPLSLSVWGNDHPIVVSKSPSRRVVARIEDGTILVSMPEGTERDRVIAAIRSLLAEEVRTALPEVARCCETRMGVSASSWRIRRMTSRWGSCNVKTRTITINSALAQFPPECLEEVVTHELCHLFERGHGERFYTLMDRYLPTWRTAHTLLKTSFIL